MGAAQVPRTMSDAPASEPLPSATVLLLRQGATGVEVFMVKRHHAIDFASGALVFPGGKVAKDDAQADLAACCRGRWDEVERAFRLAAIREAFEESGVLLARRRGQGALLDGAAAAALADWREPLSRGQRSLGALAQAADLEFALDLLLPYAHWVTPEFMPKRFDTKFYAAAAPLDQLAAHDGSESVDSLWVDPAEALEGAEAKRYTIVFATRMNLVKLTGVRDLPALLDRIGSQKIITIKPERDDNAPGGPVVRIPAEAGYGVTEMPISRLSG